MMNRGDRREVIFLGDADREWFLETLGETCRTTGWQVHALCLMSHPFDLVTETRQNNVAERGQLEHAMEQRKELEWSRASGDWKRLRRGWYWGPQEFRQEMLEWIGQKQGPKRQ